MERFVSFLAEDVRDVHVAYGREFVGKDHFRKNMPNKAQAIQRYARQITQVTLGTQVAVVVFQEQSSEEESEMARSRTIKGERSWCSSSTRMVSSPK